jgi:hypothetical protein
MEQVIEHLRREIKRLKEELDTADSDLKSAEFIAEKALARVTQLKRDLLSYDRALLTLERFDA